MADLVCVNDDETAYTTPRKGWLVNMLPTTKPIQVDDNKMEDRACLEMYFLGQDGGRFRTYVAHEPYFYVIPRVNKGKECKMALERKFEGQLLRCEMIELEDLDALNHLSFKRKSSEQGNILKLVFRTVADLMQVRKVLMPIITKNQSSSKVAEALSITDDLVSASVGASAGFFRSRNKNAGIGNVLDDFDDDLTVAATTGKGKVVKAGVPHDALTDLIDIREYDVPYYQRVCIDLNINAGCWFEVRRDPRRGCEVKKLDMVEKADPVVLAFDIECTKAPLKFPDPAIDQIYMISYMVGKVGYLIINRTIVSSDVPDFEYTPKAEFPGPFQVFNEQDERSTIIRFFQEIKQHQPNVFVTYNGDSFDFPFVEARAAIHGLSMEKEIGVSRVQAPGASPGPQQNQKRKEEATALQDATPDNDEDDDNDARDDAGDAPISSVFAGGEYRGQSSVHIDCLYWVKRDSYLPAGSRSLKAVTKAKLGYDPVEVDPEDMVRLAQERPEYMASYSVSDAVATFYLYDKYVNLFIFSLCTIIPLGPEDVLRKGSGTLCESLLMVEAFNKRIICPNKQVEQWDRFYQGHLLASETYVGGHVECLESGVFREDIPIHFELDPAAFDELIAKIDRDLTFAIEVEGGKNVSDCTNYDKVRSEIVSYLEIMRDDPKRFERPSIYHLDVGAMYPNIILTNRLQPCAVVDDSVCAACDFNRPGSDCKREMPWDWRGEMFPATKGEFNQIVTQLEYETIEGKPFRDIPHQDKARIVKSRLKDYCQVAYKRVKDTIQEPRKATICQRENPFYVDTVRAFRDRRNLYKAESKKWSKKSKASKDAFDKADCETKVLLYDSLQLAHKCILNSFYGYVMRKGARWHSMEMAAVVTRTGSDLIKQARSLVDRVGKPLELDTDGIWCVLPQTFPENFSFEFSDGGSHSISYPCVMLNADVHAKFTNHQYQDLIQGKQDYSKRSECSIFFEVDGPYRCMVLPASQEEGKLLKKRYAVFNKNGTLAELKGFELKRRGELKIVKHFQAQVFEKFLCGKSLEECYAAVGEIADFWLDVLYSRGATLSDEEVIDLISENRSMSRSLAEYGEQKSTSITTAKRLAEFLGAEMVREKGLACQLLIANKPLGAPTTDRAIPTLIFSTEPAVRDACLRRWLRDASVNGADVRDVIDWDYYIDRLGKAIQKIITIPAALQKIDNPVPRVLHPDWLARVVRDKFSQFKQTKISDVFRRRVKAESHESGDDESNDVMEVEQESIEEPNAKIKTIGITQAVEGSTEAVPFEEWLASRKAKWRQRWANKRSKGTSTSISASKPEAKSLARIMQEERAKAENEVMQIIEIRDDVQEPGVLSFIALGSDTGKLREMHVKVPRILFYDSRRDDEDNVAYPQVIKRRVRAGKMFLPRSRPCYNLFRIEVDEAEFRHNSKELLNFLTRPEVEGVYEMNLPLVHRVVNDFSACIKLRSGSNSTKALSWDDMERVESPNKVYLSTKLTRIFLYHAGQRDRQILALFVVDEDHVQTTGEEQQSVLLPKSASICKIWFTGGEERIQLDRLFEQVLHRVSPSAQSTLSSTEVVTVTSGDFMWRECGQIILDRVLKDRTMEGAAILLLQSDLGKQRVLNKLSLASEVLPALELPLGNYEFPSLQWKRLAAKRALEKYLTHAQWFADRLTAARFAAMPLGNVGEDFFVSIADTLYARDLKFSKNILWSSFSGSPDLGDCLGGESDVSSLVVESEFDNPRLNFPGAYRTFSVEIDLAHLAVNAVLEIDRINEVSLFGGDVATGEAAAVKRNANDARIEKWSAAHGDVSRSFRCLRQMVLRWFRIAVEAEEGDPAKTTAASLLVHMYRWLSSPRSYMRDPALHRQVHNAMTKLFYLLLGEIRALGGEIVFASFEKLVVSTKRVDWQSAEDWTAHMLRTLREKELFQHIVMTPSNYWRQLLFMDSFNLGGIRVDRDSPERLDLVTDSWNIVQYLPVPIQEFTRVMVGEFLYKPAKRLLSIVSNGIESVPAVEGDFNADELADPIEQDLAAFMRQLVAADFSQRLLKFVPLVVAAHSELMFPQLPGSHLDLQSPALEIIKTVCAILSLDNTCRDQVRIMKRQALKSIKVMEFSSEAQFVDPALSLVLPDLICSHCNFCEDLDLCRDPRMVFASRSDDDEEGDVDGVETDKEMRADWSCPRCSVPYDRSSVESGLCEIVQRRSLAFQLQDMVCPKCRSVRCDNLSQYCACSGKWVFAQISAQDFAKQLQAFERVAEYHGFSWLEETVEWALSGPYVPATEDSEAVNLAQLEYGSFESNEDQAD